jgi:hypothetical protein
VEGGAAAFSSPPLLPRRETRDGEREREREREREKRRDETRLKPACRHDPPWPDRE